MAAIEQIDIEPGPRMRLVPPTDAGDRTTSPLLRWSIRAIDLVSLLLAWTVATLVWPAGLQDTPRVAIGIAALTACGIVLIDRHGLYLARVAAIRTVEQALLVRVCGTLFAVGMLLRWTIALPLSAEALVVGTGFSLVALVGGRLTFRAWVSSARATGRFTQPVLLVGIDEGSAELRQITLDHPELGLRVVGALGSRDSARRNHMADIWMGDVDEASHLVATSGATGAVLSTTALEAETVNALTRTLLAQRCHVHLNTGMSGIDQRRLRPVHVGYEPLLYVEPTETRPSQRLLKRMLDLVVAVGVGLLTLPVTLVSALAIKLEDGGPVLFRQERVGFGGEPFSVLKLRTMSVGAELDLDELRDQNERKGPLFKIQFDPRVTRVGRVLRMLSIDELPQLWNVIRGEMSMVGPRPALVSEAAEFDTRLRERTNVLPGITGLWQVEARDNPSFHPYERLDLFYVENWSLGLDVMIMIATVESELGRVVSRIRQRRTVDAEPVEPATSSV